MNSWTVEKSQVELSLSITFASYAHNPPVTNQAQNAGNQVDLLFTRARVERR